MKFLSIVTFDRSGPHPHEIPGTPARLAAPIAEMREKGVLLDTGGRANDILEMQITRRNGAIAWTDRFLSLLGTGTCYLHEVSQPPE